MPDNLIFFTGLSGAGKSTVSAALRSFGVPSIYTGDVGKHVLGPDADKFDYGVHFATPEGFISRVLDHVSENEVILGRTVAVDSLRSTEEWLFVKSITSFNAWLVAVVCGWDERIRRLVRRDGANQHRIRQRDERELGQQPGSRFNVGQLVAHANYHVDTSCDADAIDRQLAQILDEVDTYCDDQLAIHRSECVA